MTTRRQHTMIITLFSLVFLFLFSTTNLSKFINFEGQAIAKTIEFEVNEHSLKIMQLQYKKSLTIEKGFLEKEKRPLVFLTFDDGPTEHTNTILSILEKYKIKATFFMLSKNMVNYPDLVKKVADAGHSIGCHGVTHKLEAFYQSDQSPVNEMEACSKTLEQLTGEGTAIIRVPFGSYPYLTAAQKENLEKKQFILWDWNVDSRDWNAHSSQKIITTVLNQVEKQLEKEVHPVILFHDKALTAESLPTILKKLQSLDYEFHKISAIDKPVQFKLKK